MRSLLLSFPLLKCNQGYDKATNRRLPTTYALYQAEKHALIRWEKALGSQTPQDSFSQISLCFQAA